MTDFRLAYTPSNKADYLALNKDKSIEPEVAKDFDNAHASLNFIEDSVKKYKGSRSDIHNMLGKKYTDCTKELECILLDPTLNSQTKAFYTELVGHIKIIRNGANARNKLLYLLSVAYPN
jgi:hypothetical protein